MNSVVWALAVVVVLGASTGAAAEGRTVKVWTSAEDMTQTLTPGKPIPIQAKAGVARESAVIEVDTGKTY